MTHMQWSRAGLHTLRLLSATPWSSRPPGRESHSLAVITLQQRRVKPGLGLGTSESCFYGSTRDAAFRCQNLGTLEDSLIDRDLLQVEQHGPGVRPAAPLARLGQLVAAGAPARRARPEHRGAAELVERHGEARHVPHAPRRPVPGGARVVPAAVLDTCAAGHIFNGLLDAVQVEVGVVVPVMQR